MRCTTRRKRRPTLEGLESRQLLSNYYLVNQASGLVLDDPGFSTSNGTLMQQYQLNGGSNQQWQFNPLSNGNFQIMNAYSGKVLDDPGFSTSAGQKIQQYQWNGGLNQQWQCLSLSNGNVEIRNAYSGKVLDDPGFSTSNGTLIQQYWLNGGSNQQWRLLGGSSASVDYVANAASGKVLDDPGFSTSNGTLIQQYQYNGGSNQRWLFVPLSNGNSLIVNGYSGKVLDDPGFSTSSGTKIQQYQLNGGSNQQWQLIDVNGNYKIRNVYSGKVLDDPSGSPSSGTKIQQYPDNGGGLNQQWALFMPNTSAGISSNWSGYVAATNLAAPQANSVSSVYGTWVVPRVTGPSTGSTLSNAWVGIDGGVLGNNTVEQIGTEQDVVNGTPVYYAWWEMFSKGLKQPEQHITSMTIMPGDVITASVNYISSDISRTHANQFDLSIFDYRPSNNSVSSFSTYQTSSQTQSPLAQRSTAEWIVEAPTVGNNVASLANLGLVTFTAASATINGVWGPINASGRQSQAINMTSDGTSTGTILDRTSILYNSGTTFVVIDTSPAAAAAVQTGGNVAAEPRSGPAVGALFQSGQPTGSPVIGGPLGMGASRLSRSRTPIGHSKDKVYLSALPGRSRIVFDKGDVGTSVLAKEGIS
jgi:hypothetical protein